MKGNRANQRPGGPVRAKKSPAGATRKSPGLGYGMCRLPETAGAGIIALDVAGVVGGKEKPRRHNESAGRVRRWET